MTAQYKYSLQATHIFSLTWLYNNYVVFYLIRCLRVKQTKRMGERIRVSETEHIFNSTSIHWLTAVYLLADTKLVIKEVQL